MPQPSPTSPTSRSAAEQPEPAEPATAEQLAVVKHAGGGLKVLAVLGRDPKATPEGVQGTSFLVLEEATGELVVASVTGTVDHSGGYEIVLTRELDEALPGPASTCIRCGQVVVGWERFCRCGVDLSGIAPESDTDGDLLFERVQQATAGAYEILGAIRYAHGGGLAYFAQEQDGREILALRMHADGVFDDGTPRLVLSATQPLGFAPHAAERSPHSGPVRYTPVHSISVVTDETAARELARPSGEGEDEVDTSELPLRGSILGSGLLAKQPTPPESEAVQIAKVCPQCGVEYDTASRFCPNDGTPLRPKGSADPYVGRVIAERYHVLKRLGEGGMGRVYLAEHVKMNRQCAVKVMNNALVNDADSAQRFAREASNAARIIHPNVAAVFDYGESDGTVYLVMEYVDGETLTRIVEREGTLPPFRALEIARQVAEALVAAHDLGIVHRDLKPDNIIVAQGKGGREIAKVVDFGIAKAVQEGPQESLTRTGLVIGTPEYMSPEQLLGDPVDARSDIYSLGCILYQMLTGRRPFDEPTREQMIKRRLTEKPPHARDVIPSLPQTLDLIIARMLGRSPQDRYASVSEVRDVLIPSIALEGGFDDPSWRVTPRSSPTVFISAAEQPTQEMTPVRGVTVQRPAWRRGSVVGSVAGGLLVLGVGGAMLTRSVADGAKAATPAGAQSTKAPIDVHLVQAPPPSAVKLIPGSTSVRSGTDSLKAKGAASRASRRSGPAAPPEVLVPVQELRTAIEHASFSEIEAVFPKFKAEPELSTFWQNVFDERYELKVRLEIQRYEAVSKKLANVDFRISVPSSRIKVTKLDASKLPPLVYRASLVLDGDKWAMQDLKLLR